MKKDFEFKLNLKLAAAILIVALTTVCILTLIGYISVGVTVSGLVAVLAGVLFFARNIKSISIEKIEDEEK